MPARDGETNTHRHDRLITPPDHRGRQRGYRRLDGASRAERRTLCLLSRAHLLVVRAPVLRSTTTSPGDVHSRPICRSALLRSAGFVDTCDVVELSDKAAWVSRLPNGPPMREDLARLVGREKEEDHDEAGDRVLRGGGGPDLRHYRARPAAVPSDVPSPCSPPRSEPPRPVPVAQNCRSVAHRALCRPPDRRRACGSGTNAAMSLRLANLGSVADRARRHHTVTGGVLRDKFRAAGHRRAGTVGSAQRWQRTFHGWNGSSTYALFGARSRGGVNPTRWPAWFKYASDEAIEIAAVMAARAAFDVRVEHRSDARQRTGHRTAGAVAGLDVDRV